jgi:hypothetical protein
MVVERTFVVLKKRWKNFRHLDYSNLMDMKHIILTCCILHNMELKTAEEIDADYPLEGYHTMDDAKEMEEEDRNLCVSL